MKLSSYSLIIGLLAFSFSAMAQEQDITVRLHTPGYFKGTRGRDISNLKEVQVWCVNNKPDSILWAVNYWTGKDAACKDMPRLQVLTKREGNKLQVCILKRHNPFLKKEEVLSYAYDSLKKWNKKNSPEDAIPRLVIELPYCINNAITFQPIEMYLFPFFVGHTHGDPCLNEMPLAASLGRSGVAEFGNAVLYFNNSDYMLPDSKLIIKVKENGVMQNDKISNQLVYKENYRMTDTLVIGGELFKIDSIGSQWEMVYMRRLTKTGLAAKMPERHMRELAPYFEKAKEYLLLDFWGTWCAPCIAAMPEMRELYDEVRSEVPFVSVCFDNPRNYPKAKEIFLENRLEWPQIFNSMAEKQYTITRDLSITTFPTYMLVKKNGDIFFSSGPEGFEELRRILQQHK